MKETHRPYSPLIVTFKVATIPSILAVTDKFISTLIIDNSYIDEISTLSKSLLILFIELFFIIITKFVNNYEVSAEIKKNKKHIEDLKKFQLNCDPANKNEISKQIKNLEKEIINLMPR